jgi:hypothetical protein
MSESEAMFAELEAIDATLAGAPVDPAHAELAELALLLAAERPAMPADVGSRIDQRVAELRPKPRPRRSFVFRPAFGIGLAGALAAGIAVIVITSGSGAVNNELDSSAKRGGVLVAPRLYSPSVRHGVVRPGVSASGPVNGPITKAAKSSAGATQNLFGAVATVTTASAGPAVQAAKTEDLTRADGTAGSASIPAPINNGTRKQIQSAQLQLISAGDRIDTVAEEVFRVVAAQSGIVKSSQVTAGSGNSGFANFSLSIPTVNLQQAMTSLSELQYAHVASRTDQTNDVTNQYNSDQEALANALALRTALLKQLANAVTTAQIDSLQAQLADDQATIRADRKAVGGLNDQINYSNLNVQINAGIVPVITQPQAKGFTLHKAVHDALRVLVVVLGVLLIALAVLIPLSALLALGWFCARTVRMRRRERALDAE